MKIELLERSFKVPILNDLDKGWLASAIDGEGCIYIRLMRSTKSKNHNKLRIDLKLYNTNFDYVHRAALLTHVGYITRRKQTTAEKKYGKKYIPYFTWSCENHVEVLTIIKQIEPYLIIKRQKAQHVIKLLELRKQNPNHRQITNVQLLIMAGLSQYTQPSLPCRGKGHIIDPDWIISNDMGA